MDEETALRLLEALLDNEGAEHIRENSWLRFRAKHGGMVWETACRPREEGMLFFARFPFTVKTPEKARLICEELNRRLIRGALFLGEDGSPVYRCLAELDDVYGAEDRLAAALEYSGRVLAHCWGRLSGV